MTQIIFIMGANVQTAIKSHGILFKYPAMILMSLSQFEVLETATQGLGAIYTCLDGVNHQTITMMTV